MIPYPNLLSFHMSFLLQNMYYLPSREGPCSVETLAYWYIEENQMCRVYSWIVYHFIMILLIY